MKIYLAALDKLTVVVLHETMEPELMFFESIIVGSDAEVLAAVGGVVQATPGTAGKGSP